MPTFELRFRLGLGLWRSLLSLSKNIPHPMLDSETNLKPNLKLKPKPRIKRKVYPDPSRELNPKLRREFKLRPSLSPFLRPRPLRWLILNVTFILNYTSRLS